MIKCWALSFACLLFIPNATSSTETFPSIAALTQTMINSNWKTLEDRSFIRQNRPIQLKQAKTFQKIKDIDAVLRQLEKAMSWIPYDVILDVALTSTKSLRDEMLFYDFLQMLEQIDAEYDRLQEYSSEGKLVHSSTMIDFANVAVSHQASSVKMLIEKIHQHIVPVFRYGSRGGILKLLIDNKDALDEIVRRAGESPNQFLYNFFNKIALVQIKGYALIQLSYTILEIYRKGYYWRESRMTNIKMRRRLRELSQETIRKTATVSQQYWKFDPEKYKNEENYLEISRLIQGYVVNEKVLNNGKSCYGQCEAYKEVNVVNCRDDPFCRKQSRCGNKLYSCRRLKTADMQICLAPTGTSRRYNYIEFGKNDVLGEKSNCSAPTIRVDPWIGWCPYCMCFCDDEGFYSERYFSLRHAVSDIKNNKVVTGIRFAKNNKIIHLQVQQGEILPYGLINASSLEWVPIDKFRITDRYVYNKQDYLKMTWNDNVVYLHVLQVENKTQHDHTQQVLTGVRFSGTQTRSKKNAMRTHLNFEIRMTKFDFVRGVLLASGNFGNTWIRSFDTEFSRNPRTKIPIENVDIPTRAKSKNTIISSKESQYVEFTRTDMYKDAGQTTVPFIDSQDVVTRTPTPLIGAGVYYKSTPGYGGFIGLKIVTYDLAQHLHSSFL